MSIEAVTAPCVITLHLTGSVTPKSRPRFGGGHAHLPKRYRVWKERAIAELTHQYQGEPLTGVCVTILLQGKGHRLNGDLDNLSGAILDALVQAKVLQDDSLKHVQRLLVESDRTFPDTRVVISICSQ